MSSARYGRKSTYFVHTCMNDIKSDNGSIVIVTPMQNKRHSSTGAAHSRSTHCCGRFQFLSHFSIYRRRQEIQLHLAQMEREFSKERKPTISLMSKRFRFFVCFVAIACVSSCTAILFFSLTSLVSVQRRLALVESKLDAISEKFEQSPPEVDTKDSPIARHKRRADPLNSLADLSKRLMALEIR